MSLGIGVPLETAGLEQRWRQGRRDATASTGALREENEHPISEFWNSGGIKGGEMPPPVQVF
jgi:hypothetical protein